MALPISRNQLDRLGERLAASDTPSEDDQALLLQVLRAYEDALRTVRVHLLGLGFTVTGRLKTIGTLVDKLRREPGMRLKSVQDVAGLRIVVPGTRRDQDEVVARVVAAFAAEAKPPVVRDRRILPSSGYRAVHVVVFESRLPVEVQVRTKQQDLWAQVFERLGDRWGRTIRYGGFPDEPDMIALEGDPPVTRRQVVQRMQRLSGEIDRFERVKLAMLDVEDGLAAYSGDRDDEEYFALATDWRESRAAIAEGEASLSDTLTSFLRYATQEA